MAQPEKLYVYIFVANKGFVQHFDLSGAELQFVQTPAEGQDFDTERQANYIIRVNKLDPAACFLVYYNPYTDYD